MKDGSCLGSLCILDTRPRLFHAADIQLLEDFRDLAVVEIERNLAADGFDSLVPDKNDQP